MDQERDIVGADFQHHLRPFDLTFRSIPEARIEESGIVGAQFSAGRFIGDHLGGVAGRHADPFLGGEDVKLFRLQKQAVMAMAVERLPKVCGGIVPHFGQVNDVAVLLGAIADDARTGPVIAFQIDAQEQPAFGAELPLSQRFSRGAIVIEQRGFAVERFQGGVAYGGLAADKPDLVEGLAGPDFDGEGPGHDFKK
jgi:hypothetical protein